jgi:hypothetical protein
VAACHDRIRCLRSRWIFHGQLTRGKSDHVPRLPLLGRPSRVCSPIFRVATASTRKPRLAKASWAVWAA